MTARVDAQAASEQWTIYVCDDCGVQSPPHHKGCPQARRKWFSMREVEVVPAARLEAAETALEAISEQRCNGCKRPKREWGPYCSGMTVGDATHYHSPAWWIALAAGRGERG